MSQSVATCVHWSIPTILKCKVDLQVQKYKWRPLNYGTSTRRQSICYIFIRSEFKVWQDHGTAETYSYEIMATHFSENFLKYITSDYTKTI